MKLMIHLIKHNAWHERERKIKVPSDKFKVDSFCSYILWAFKYDLFEGPKDEENYWTV